MQTTEPVPPGPQPSCSQEPTVSELCQAIVDACADFEKNEKAIEDDKLRLELIQAEIQIAMEQRQVIRSRKIDLMRQLAAKVGTSAQGGSTP